MINVRKDPVWQGLLGATLSLAVAGCGSMGPEPAAQASTEVKAVPVTVAALERRPIERTVDVIGSLRGWEQVTVGTKRSGRVVKVYHDMGDRVDPGAPLVELEAIDAKLAVEEAESKYLGALVKLGITRKQAADFVKTYGISEELLYNRLTSEAITRIPSVIEKQVARDKAHQNLLRQRTLTQRGAGTTQELEDAQNEERTANAAYENALGAARTVIADAISAKVELSKAEQTLQDMTIRAPQPRLLPPSISRTSQISYGVTRRQVSEGQILKEGEAVAEMVIEDPLRLWTQVPEQHSDEVRVGQLARLSARSHPGMTFEGRVSRISPSVDPSNRTFQVETIVPNERGLLRPGGLASASIVVDSQAKAAVVPFESIVHFAGVTKLFLVDHGKARAINDIKTGKEGRGWVEIVSPQLPAATKVVTTGQSQLADGTAVRIRGE
jgi:multidrug efflux pump subunit AcrA (membrane-fusion protein)